MKTKKPAASYRIVMLGVVVAVAHATVPNRAKAQLVVAKTGNDDNTCITESAPCLTIPGAIAKIPAGALTAIRVLGGTYSEPINIYHHRSVLITGPLAPDGSCPNNAAVVLTRTTPGNIIWVQDNAIGIFSCFSLVPSAAGVSGLGSRQYSVADYSDIRFHGMPDGQHVMATEASKVNCGGYNEIAGGAAIHASAGDASLLFMPCKTRLLSPGISFGSFFSAETKSVIRAENAQFAGPEAIGKQYSIYDSTLRLPAGPAEEGWTRAIPGSGGDSGDYAVIK